MADLTPMDLGEILDGSLAIYRRHFGLLIQLGVLALWAPAALNVYVQLAGGQGAHPLLALLAGVLQYLGGLLLTAGAIRVISDSYLDRAPQLRDAVALGASKIWPLFVVGLGYAVVLGLCGAAVVIVAAVVIPLMAQSGAAVAVLVGSALVAVGVWFVIFVACGYALTTPVVVLEALGSAFDAFGRSWDLTRGYKWKVFATALVALIILSLPTAAVAALGQGLMVTTGARGLGEFFAVLAALLPIVVTPLLSCVFTLMYYDLRVRREAFDLQVLGQQLGIV